MAPSTHSSPDVVVLSPHLDDAVFSVGASIAKMSANGVRVEVWTCFTRAPGGTVPQDRRVFADYETRCREDVRALGLLGATHRWLDLTERIWRTPPLARIGDVFRTPDDVSEFPYLESLGRSIGDVLSASNARVYAPLGVGNHHDHVHVALAAMRTMAEAAAFDRFVFYEDFYALGRGGRRRHFVTGASRERGIFGPAWASPKLAVSLASMSRQMRGPGIERYFPAVNDFTWESSVERVDGFDAVFGEAVAAYASQTRVFGGTSRLMAILRRARELAGGEVTWTARANRA